MSDRYDCSDPEQRAAGLKAAAAAVRRGELVVLPTDTVYGIGADAFTPVAVSGLLAAKHRGRDMPPPVLVGSVRTAVALVDNMSETGRDFIDEFWPGGLTMVCRARPTLSWDLGRTKGTVAVRMPSHQLALELLKETGPLAVSSANISGSPPAATIDEAIEQFGDSVAVYLDGGRSTSDVPSTIIDLTGIMPRLLREGAISLDQLYAVAAVAPVSTAPAPADDDEDDEDEYEDDKSEDDEYEDDDEESDDDENSEDEDDEESDEDEDEDSEDDDEYEDDESDDEYEDDDESEDDESDEYEDDESDDDSEDDDEESDDEYEYDEDDDESDDDEYEYEDDDEDSEDDESDEDDDEDDDEYEDDDEDSEDDESDEDDDEDDEYEDDDEDSDDEESDEDDDEYGEDDDEYDEDEDEPGVEPATDGKIRLNAPGRRAASAEDRG